MVLIRVIGEDAIPDDYHHILFLYSFVSVPKQNQFLNSLKLHDIRLEI